MTFMIPQKLEIVGLKVAKAKERFQLYTALDFQLSMI